MKTIIVLFFTVVAVQGHSQTSDVIIEEKSSSWIKTAATNTVRPRSATPTVRKTNSNKPAKPKQNADQDFDKTNQQVNRFKKQKKSS